MPCRCPRCSRAVYFMERAIGPGGKTYHKPCLKCTSCNKTLDQGSVVDHDLEPYCKPCHSRNFGPRGYNIVHAGHGLVGEYATTASPTSSPSKDAPATSARSPSLRTAGAASPPPTLPLPGRPASTLPASGLVQQSTVPSKPTPPPKPSFLSREGVNATVASPSTKSPYASPSAGAPRSSMTTPSKDLCRKCGTVAYAMESVLAAGAKAMPSDQMAQAMLAMFRLWQSAQSVEPGRPQGRAVLRSLLPEGISVGNGHEHSEWHLWHEIGANFESDEGESGDARVQRPNLF
ncbi:hypothetical protein ACM66B_006953 [Microbotryomycetes sp. NB124-2]